MPAFCRLADPDHYLACDWNLTDDSVARVYWISFFLDHFRTILDLGVEAALARGEDRQALQQRRDACIIEFDHEFAAYRDNPQGIVTILTLDRWRDRILRKHGFIDCFIDLKARENERMLPLLPTVCRQLDALDEPLRLRAMIEGVFAGNIFDMGAKATAAAFKESSPDFFATRAALPERPWLIDDFDALASAWLSKTYRKAVLFVDNAGSDFLLGVVPMARWLGQRGTPVILAANERPTLNDMTRDDIAMLWPEILKIEPSLASLPISLVSTGTGEPLIDLSEVNATLNAAADDADLVILEGMGRGVETNLDAHFDCDTLNIAMLKDEMIARRQRGKLFDVVCRFRRFG